MRTFSALLIATFFATATLQPGCNRDQGTERWVTTENTNVAIDWDKVNEAYKLAEGPEDFEKRVNEIYAGDEVVSVSVKDVDGGGQVVTGFFDKNSNGTVEDDEKIFSIQRQITGEGQAQYQTQGYGYYGGYHSPMLSIVSGMVIGSMLSSAFSPRYVPVYTTPYTTSPQRASSLRSYRGGYRAANPSRFRTAPKASGSGRSYGSKGGGGGFGRSGGGRFGVRRAAGAPQPVRLSA
jgi:hypothetical protein